MVSDIRSVQGHQSNFSYISLKKFIKKFTEVAFATFHLVFGGYNVIINKESAENKS